MLQVYGTLEWDKVLKRLKDNDRTLTQLDLSSNNIGASGAKDLSWVLKNNRTLTQLNLKYNNIEASGAKDLSWALKDNRALTQLDLEYNNIGNCGAKDLSLALKDNHTLRQLDLRANYIEDSGAKGLSLALKDNHTLTQLDLCCNQIGDSGAKDLSWALKNNRTLMQLDLSYNQRIGDSGAKDLSLALKDNHTLTQLNLNYNKITGSGAKGLSLALKDNHTLTQLDLGYNQISDSGAKDLSWTLKDNRTLTQLNLSSNQIGASGAKDLSWALKDHRTLTQLDLSSNNIGDSGAKDLSWALKDNRTLTQLDLRNNQIEENGAKELNLALKANRSLTQLDLRGNEIKVNLKKEIDQQLAENKAYQVQLHQKPALQLATVASVTSLQLISLQHALSSEELLTASATQRGKQEMRTERSTQPTTPTSPQLAVSFIIPYKDLTIGKEIGRGTFGIVYQGEWCHTAVAIKQLLLSNPSSDSIKEFQQEMATMARLHSPYIVQLYGICQEIGRYCIVMEYMPKGSLYSVLHSQEPLSWMQRERIALDIAKGLAYLHQGQPGYQILHRDLKSLNVLLDEQYHAKLTDFGLSKVKQEVTSKSSMSSNKAVGTLAWMAPELFDTKPQYTVKSDIYGYGMVLWELSARQVPFKEVANPGVVAAQICMGKRADIPQDTPPKLAKLITFCWAQDPHKRPTSSQVISELQAAQDSDEGAKVSKTKLVYENNLASQNTGTGNGPQYYSNTYSKR